METLAIIQSFDSMNYPHFALIIRLTAIILVDKIRSLSLNWTKLYSEGPNPS